MDDVAATSGRGKQAMNGTGAMLPPGGEHHGSFKGSFDLDDGGLISRPRTLIAIAVGMFVIGGGVALIYLRLDRIETAVAEIPAAIDRRIEQSEIAAEQQRKIDCLQQQITNKSWTCPYAVQIAKEPEPVKRRTVVTTAKTPEPSFWPFSAQAKGTK